jgi:hypothetical protein
VIKPSGYRKKRKLSGQVIAETPLVLYVLFFLLAFPMIAMGSFLLRSVLFYFSVRESINRAGRAPTFTQAQSNAATVFANDTWYATSGTEQIRIVIQNIANGGNTYSTTKLGYGTIDISKNMYLIQGIAQANITPLIPVNLFGVNVPGLTGPYPLTITAQTYSEYPNGLWE